MEKLQWNKKREKRGAGEEDLTEIERKVDLEDKHVSMGLCPCASVCDRQLYSRKAEGHGCHALRTC